MKKPKPKTEAQAPAAPRRLIATIRIPSPLEESNLVTAANECVDILEGSPVRGL